jgi:hypothetical protein
MFPWLSHPRQKAPSVAASGMTTVADRARAIAAGLSDGTATARARTASGRWVLVRGSALGNGARTAVTLGRRGYPSSPG